MYAPEPPPRAVDDLLRYVADELDRISGTFTALEVPFIKLTEQHVAPDKPEKGQIYYADGTDWDPGAGEGYYGYTSAGYVKL